MRRKLHAALSLFSGIVVATLAAVMFSTQQMLPLDLPLAALAALAASTLGIFWLNATWPERSQP